MNDQTGYRDLTPRNGLVVGNKKIVRTTLLDDNGAGLSAKGSVLKLSVIQPTSGLTEIAGIAFTDNANGTYDYRFHFDEVGTYYGYFTYDESPRKLIDAWKLTIKPLIS